MRRIFLKRYETGYGIVEDSQTINFDLYYLWESFYVLNNEIQVDEFDEDWITVWNAWNLKNKKWKNFISLEEQRQYDAAYSQYNRKRWDDMPILRITKQNHDQVLKEWRRLKKNKASYGIISMDDAGWVRIEGKDKLDEQDVKDIKEEHQRYLRFQEKFEAYWPFRRGKNKVWESENDSEYYSDYLTEEEMVWKKKKF